MKRGLRLLLQGLFLLLLAGCVVNGTSTTGTKVDENEVATNRARAHTGLGAAYLQQNKLEIALDEFSKAVQIAPNFALAYNGLGLVYGALGEDTKAEANFKRSIELLPNSSESHNNYGNFLCSRKRYDESITQFLEAVKNPLYATPNLAYANAGICADMKKDTKSAEVYLNKALQIEPLTHSAAYRLADIQFRRGDAQLAKKTLQNTLIAQPSAEVLWLGVQISRVLGDKDSEASYALQLRKLYPNAEQTQLLLSGQQ